MLTAILLITAAGIVLGLLAIPLALAIYAIYKASLYRSRLMIGKDPRTGQWINLPTSKGN